MFTTKQGSQVSMRCTGISATGCTKNVPFRVYKKSIETSAGLHTGCDVEKVLSVLGVVLPADAQVTRTAADLNIYSLCEKCWAEKDAQWDKGVYLGAAARAVADGMYFNAERDDFKTLDKKGPNIRKIKCTVVHEMVHWTVAGTTKGFQNMAGGACGLQPADWDECMTDYLARRTYKQLNWGEYETLYNKLPTFMDEAISLLKATPKFKAKTVIPLLKQAFPGLDENAADFKAEVDKLKDPLFRNMAKRYVKGKDLFTHPGEGATFSDFVNKVFPGNLGGKLSAGGGLYGTAVY